jgi:hypothetical protein
MIRGLRSELRRYTGIQPVAAFAIVAGLEAAQAISGIQSIHLYPSAAPDAYTLASAAGSLAGAAHQMATAGGVCVAILIAYYGWIADYQHGMMPTLLLFERRRWLLLTRKFTAAIVLLATAFLLSWVALWLVINLALSPGDSAPLGQVTVSWSQSFEVAGKSAVVSLGYVSTAVLLACLTRRLVPTAVVMASCWFATLPLAPISELRAYLPQVWIASWVGLPDSLQFTTYFWPSADLATAGKAFLTIALFIITTIAATCAYLLGPTTRAED